MSGRCRTILIGLALAAMIACPDSWAQTWLGVPDAAGCTWARVKIVNLSTNEVDWAISNCRTAIESTDNSVVTDAFRDWDGVVPAGEARYVWIYGLLSGEINMATAGGTATGYSGYIAPSDAGNGELVLTVDANGAVAALVEPATYDVPTRSGTMPNLEVEEELP